MGSLFNPAKGSCPDAGNEREAAHEQDWNF